jgi:hypothetical protein
VSAAKQPVRRYLTQDGTWKSPNAQDRQRAELNRTRGKRAEPAKNFESWGDCEGQASLFGD